MFHFGAVFKCHSFFVVASLIKLSTFSSLTGLNNGDSCIPEDDEINEEVDEGNDDDELERWVNHYVSLLPAATRLGMDSTESDGCKFFINLHGELIMSVMFSQAAAT